MASTKLVAITDMQAKSKFKLTSGSKDDLDEFREFKTGFGALLSSTIVP